MILSNFGFVCVTKARKPGIGTLSDSLNHFIFFVRDSPLWHSLQNGLGRRSTGNISLHRHIFHV
jgi:hypothetical protein